MPGIIPRAGRASANKTEQRSRQGAGNSDAVRVKCAWKQTEQRGTGRGSGMRGFTS